MKRYIQWIIRHRFAVIAAIFLVTILAVYQAKNLKVVIDPNTLLPQSHPVIVTGLEIEKVFGSKYIVIVGVSPKNGDIYQPSVLRKVQNMTAAFLQAKGVVKENLLSLSTRRVKGIIGTPDGMEVKPLMEDNVPETDAQIAALRATVEKNPVFRNSIVSEDGKMTAIVAEFKDVPGGFRAIMDQVDQIVEHERDDSVTITVGGSPRFLARVEAYSDRMGLLFPLAIVVLSLVLFAAFRTKQGLILPLVTGLTAVAWGVGIMGASGIPMDVFNATTPILILAIATGHSVQLLKRYYEEYHKLRTETAMSPKDANNEAIVISVQHVGSVMLAAGAVASIGFFSLVTFDISTVRTFGIFTGLGILTTMILEMTFVPALRSILAPPVDGGTSHASSGGVWDHATRAIGEWVTNHSRQKVYWGLILFVATFLAGMGMVVVNNSTKSYFSPGLAMVQDDKVLNEKLGGTNSVFVLVEGESRDAIKNPKTLKAMDELQQFLGSQPFVGKTMSIADFIKRMNQSMHGDDPAYFRIPESQELVSQYLLLYSMSGEPGDFDAYVDYDYRRANMTVFVKTDSSAYVDKLTDKITVFAKDHFPSDVKIRIAGGVPEGAALSEVMVHGKILNIVQIATVVFFISCLLFRSLAAGVIVLLPLLIATIVNFGLMGWSGISLNISTSLISAMAVGIGADYAIYLIYRIREELKSEPNEAAAVKTVLRTAGKAILFVATAVAAGYGVLLFSFGFYIHQWLAILIAAAMMVSAFAALLLIPALILTFRPDFVYRGLTPKLTSLLGALTLILGVGSTMLPNDSWAASVDLVQIMEKEASVTKVVDSVADSTITLINKTGEQRIRKTFGTTKLQPNGVDNMRMTRFMFPPDVKGTVSLLIEHSDKDDDIWIYLPALKKVRRLVSSNKKDSFVGTDFSYADVIGYKVNEWTYKLLKEEAVDGQSCYVIEATPKSEDVKNDSGYSRRVAWVRKDNQMTVKAEFYDISGEMLKTTTFSDIREVDAKHNKWQAMRLEATNVQTGHRTVITFDNFKVSQNVKADFFTTRYMERE